jgi:hypothetical protein
MKTTNKNRKYKKITNKRRKGVKNSKKNNKKIKGGDKVIIRAYPALPYDKIDPEAETEILYKVIAERDFPAKPIDAIIYAPYRDVEQTLAEIKHGINQEDFKSYPKSKHDTVYEINFDDL